MNGPSAPTPEPPLGYRRGATSGRILFMSYFGTLAEGAVFLLLTPFLLRRLGPAAYGVWTLGITLADWLQLLDFGLREAVLKFSAAHQARSDRSSIRRLAETALTLYAGLGVLALAVGLSLAWIAVPILVEDRAAWGDLRGALVILSVSAMLSYPLGLSGSLLEGLLRFDLLNLIRFVHSIVRLSLIVLALQFEHGVVGVACAELVSRMTLHAMRWRALATTYPEVLPRFGFHRSELSRLVHFGVWNGVRYVVEVATSRLFEPLLSMFAGLPAVGAFYAGRRLATMPAEAIVPLAAVLFPLASELDASGREAALRDSLVKASKFAWTLALPLAMLLSLGAGPIQANWLGGRAPEAVGVLQVFAGAFVLTAASLPSESILLGIGRARLLAGSGIAQASITLLVGVPLTASYGAKGLAWGAFVGVLFGQAIVQIGAAAPACGLPLGRFLRQAFLPGALAALPVGAVLWWTRDAVASGGLAALAAWGSGGLVAYGALIWRLGFDRDERAFLRTHARRIFVRLDPTGPAA
jgi:O-antigen/teichoic acid export membrane protein